VRRINWRLITGTDLSLLVYGVLMQIDHHGIAVPDRGGGLAVDKHLIGSMISLMRKEKGLTGERFAELLGVSPQAVSKWENGKCLPETSMLPLIPEVLGVSIGSLLMPKKLIVLNAVYSDGEKQFNVTQILNNHVIGNRLSIVVNAQFLGASLHTLVGSFEAEYSNRYFQGAQAYEKWIAGLRNEQLWDQGSAKDDVDRRLAVNDCMLLNLVDARRCAAAYLSECVSLLKDERADLLAEIASLYRGISEQLSSFRNKMKTSDGERIRYNAVDTKVSTRFLKEQASLLESVL
jgi:transcriptional regulator with XRE-family HTH domain